MAERLAGGNAALALLANSVATAAALVALIFTFAPISGAHFNPVVTLSALIERSMTLRESAWYVAAQVAGAISGGVVANLMFDLPLVSIAEKSRGGTGQLVAELVATFGLVLVIHGTSTHARVVPITVASYIAAAYWFTSSTSFANPAVTIARTLSNTFTGIRPADVLAFVAMQIIAAIASTFFYRWMSSGTTERRSDS